MLAAYICRYGHQALPVVLAMTRRDAEDFAKALSRWVGRDNPLVGG